MKHYFKRMFAMLLASLTLISVMTLTASAVMYSGQYNGYSYTTRVTVTGSESYATARITYAGPTSLSGDGTVYYANKNKPSVTGQFDLDIAVGYSDVSNTVCVYLKNRVTRIEEDFYIGSTIVETMDETF